MTTSMVTPDSALVKTAPGAWVVIEPAEQAAVRRLAPRVYAELSRRLSSGRPFETPAGAWTGQEPLDSEGDVTASIVITGQNAIHVTFTTRHLDFGRLAIAKRLGKGAYEVYLSEAGFYAWIERLAPPPKSPAELAALELERAHPELAARIERALALVQAGQTEFPQYDTGAELTTREPTRHCNCKDAEYRAPHVAGIGVACKHTLAQLIAERVATDTYNAGARKRIDKQQMRQGWHLDPDRSVDPVIPAEPTAEYQRVLAQELARRGETQDVGSPQTALPAWAGRNDDIEAWL